MQSNRSAPPENPSERIRSSHTHIGRAGGAAPRSPVIPSRLSNRRENLPDERYSGTTSLAPRIYEGGGPRSGRGSPPQRRGKPPQSRLRRDSSPKGEAKGAAPRSPVIPSRLSDRRENPPDERYSGTTSLAPRIYEGGGPRSGRGSPPPQRRGKHPQSRLRRASSPGGEAKGAAPRSPVIPGRLSNRRENLPDERYRVSLCAANPAGKNSFSAIENTCFLPAAVI